MSGKLGIGFTSKIVPVKPINDQMTLCKCYIMALGKNRNMTNISKESVDDALPSLFNVPVVGHIFVDEDKNVRMGGHDVALERDEGGKYKFKTLTVPYGTVPQQDNVHYESLETNGGNSEDYLVADIILWTGRYPELLDAKYGEEVYFAQSMEIIPTEISEEDGYRNIDKFQFSALCLLGKSDDKDKNVEPCFESARVEPYDFSAEDNWSKLFEEFKEELAKSYSKACIEEGGKKMLKAELIKTILLEFGLAEDAALNFEVTEDMTEEEFRRKLKIMCELDNSANSCKIQHTESDCGSKDDNKYNKFALETTMEDKKRLLSLALGKMSIWDENNYAFYSLVDFDIKYAYYWLHVCGKDVEDKQLYERATYVISDDIAEIDFSTAESVRLVWLTKEQEDQITNEKEQFDKLVDYKKQREADDRQKAFGAVIAEFSDLSEIDEFKELVKNSIHFEDLETFTEKLYAIRGKLTKKPVKKSLDTIRIPVGFETKKNSDDEMDEFMNTYLK